MRSCKGQKRYNFGEDLFFGRSPHFGRKIRLYLIKDRLKSGSRSFDVFSSLQNSPPPNANFWLRACLSLRESCKLCNNVHAKYQCLVIIPFWPYKRALMREN